MKVLNVKEFEQLLKNGEYVITHVAPPTAEELIVVARDNMIPPFMYYPKMNETFSFQVVVFEKATNNQCLLYVNSDISKMIIVEHNNIKELHSKQILISDFRLLFATDEEAKQIASENNIPATMYVGKLDNVKEIKKTINDENLRKKIDVVSLAFVSKSNNSAIYAIKNVPELQSGIFAFNINELHTMLKKDLVIDYNELIN
jgi:hypothetical protein